MRMLGVGVGMTAEWTDGVAIGDKIKTRRSPLGRSTTGNSLIALSDDVTLHSKGGRL